MQVKETKNTAVGDRVYTLSDYRFIEIAGPDAITFIQAQVTSDMRRLEKNDWLLGAQCNPKGRMVLSFVAFLKHNNVYLRVHKSLEQAFDGLKKYAVFTKVKFSLLEMPSVALVGEDMLKRISQTLNLSEPLAVGKCQIINEAVLVARAEDWLEVYGQTKELTAWINSSTKSGSLNLADNFDGELIKRGIAEVRGATAEEFIPQMFNLDHVDAVSFKKGCYTGQEVVARMQYLGKLKKHLYRGKIEDASVPVGAQLHSSEYPEPQGTVVLSCGDEFLAVVNDHVMANHTLLSPAHGQSKIQWLPLPYAITM
ncbi:MAG: folate-binding protein [Moraxellaceae bacterium]|jgi:tRNA-modifying protein YgfZ|nr:MAG: folate-binding protein [Moraxellaceae bacterium]